MGVLLHEISERVRWWLLRWLFREDARQWMFDLLFPSPIAEHRGKRRIVCPACGREYLGHFAETVHASFRCHCGAEVDVEPKTWRTTLREWKNVKGEDKWQRA